jgi:hypothetical protein
MKELHRKGLANHPDPESCMAGREAAIEALTGAHAGRVLSCEITISSRVPTASNCRKATPRAALLRAVRGLCAVRDPEHVWNLHAREPGDPNDACHGVGRPVGEGHAP